MGGDWHRSFALPSPRLIVDVGAHRGESVDRFSMAFPDAAIFAFEPVAENFRILRQEQATRRHVTCLPLAVSDRVGEFEMELQSDSQTHSLEKRRTAGPHGSGPCEKIRLTTLDAAATDHGWTAVDLLKIDVEGHELAVLRGARGLLEHGNVGAIFAEATLDSRDSTHTPLGTLGGFLADRHFRLAGIYDQCATGHAGALGYFNALFLRHAPTRRAS